MRKTGNIFFHQNVTDSPFKVHLILEQKLVISKNNELFIIILNTTTSMIVADTMEQTCILYYDVTGGITK